MTNEELLQQAKDQVAEIAGFTDWADLITKSTYLTYTDEKANEAALLAIQRAREAKYVQGIEAKIRAEVQAAFPKVNVSGKVYVDEYEAYARVMALLIKEKILK